MDTLIFVALIATAVTLFRKDDSRIATALWWVTLVLTVLLLSHHITSGLGLGLSW